MKFNVPLFNMRVPPHALERERERERERDWNKVNLGTKFVYKVA